MKSNYKIGAAVIGSFVLGVGASSILHAQAKPPAFVWAEIDIKDRVGYFGNFAAPSLANIKESGGKYLADALKAANDSRSNFIFGFHCCFPLWCS